MTLFDSITTSLSCLSFNILKVDIFFSVLVMFSIYLQVLIKYNSLPYRINHKSKEQLLKRTKTIQITAERIYVRTPFMRQHLK